MRTYSQKEIRDLRRTGRVTDTDGKKLKPALLHKKPKTPLTSEERQAKAIEQIPIEIEKVLKSNTSYATILLEMIRKIRTDVKLSVPEPTKKWSHVFIRGGDGKIKEAISEKIE